jgi:hypothetical protein
MAPAPAFEPPHSTNYLEARATKGFLFNLDPSSDGFRFMAIVLIWIMMALAFIAVFGTTLYMMWICIDLYCYQPCKKRAKKRAAAAAASARNHNNTARRCQTATTRSQRRARTSASGLPSAYESEAGIELPGYPDAVRGKV